MFFFKKTNCGIFFYNLIHTLHYLLIYAIYLKAREDHRVKSKALFVAIGINNTGHKEVLGFEVYDSEKVNTWRDFFENLKSRGLRGVDIVISDAHAGLVEAIKESFSGSSWQRCQAHFTRNIIDKCPKKYSTGLASELRDMFNAATIEESRRLKESIYDEYQDVANEAMTVLDEGFEDSITIMALGELPAHLQNYIDYAAYGRDMELEGTFVVTNHGVYEILR